MSLRLAVCGDARLRRVPWLVLVASAILWPLTALALSICALTRRVR